MRPFVIAALPPNTGSSSDPFTSATISARAGAADVPEKALEEAEVRVARRAQRDLAVVQPDLAANVELGALACEAQTADADGVAIERELDRSVVADGIVEKLQIQRVHRRVDEKMVDVGELPGDTDRTARRRRSCTARAVERGT